MFVKLNRQFNDLSYQAGKEAISYGGIISYEHIDNVSDNLLRVIPKKYQDSFALTVMRINNNVPPHTDSEAKAVINFYIKSYNGKTIFFDGDSETYQIPNQTNGQMYIRENLTEAGSFIAKDGEAFCLNVEKPHAVDFDSDEPKERIAICLSTGDYSFEQVCNMLCDTGYIN